MIKVAVAFALLTTWCSAASAQSYAFGTGAFNLAQGPTAIVAADFNRDGRIDVAVADAHGVSVLLGEPDGSFALKVDYSVGGVTPTGLAAGDVNGDGKVDLIVLAANVEILIGNGNGTFQAATSVPLSNFSGFTAVTTGDFYKDGKLDLAITASGASGPEVAILLGKGNGTFGTAVGYSTAGSFSVITGDFTSS